MNQFIHPFAIICHQFALKCCHDGERIVQRSSWSFVSLPRGAGTNAGQDKQIAANTLMDSTRPMWAGMADHPHTQFS